ncbi:hypothetical protein BRADI_3g22047v3 [Brachypodium distachyon]|uniref:Uncharacterized protein n=1 Tax=Brachypodium distachyon TaxID=15368 RepID=A0A2K2CYS0_BRADI|nr:hypothetical protein BRADI_3g22047v3 [Brachypodium distachyon]
MEELSTMCEKLAGLQLDPQLEAERVNSRLSRLNTSNKSSFWYDRDRGRALALMQDRVDQIGGFADSCRSTLEHIYQALFPLRRPPAGLEALMQKFRGGTGIQDFARSVMIRGAQHALAFALVKHPSLDLDHIHELPVMPGETIDIRPQIDRTLQLARWIIFLHEEAEQMQLEANRVASQVAL